MHERGVVESEPGLYFVGRFFQLAFTSSLIGGVGRDAEYIARHQRSGRLPLYADERNQRWRSR